MTTHRMDNPSREGKNMTPKAEKPAKKKKRLYSIDEAAAYLGRSRWSIREMLWAGKLPYVKDGRRILVDKRDMWAWIKENKTRDLR